MFKKIWKYLGTLMGMKFEEHADIRVQLEQAIKEAEKQHLTLRERAAEVIANQKQIEVSLNRAIKNRDNTEARARQALAMAEDARRAGDPASAGNRERAAKNFAQRLKVLRDEVDSLETRLVNAAQASDTVKTAIAQNADLLRQKMSERQELLNKLGEAEMAEQMNESMAALNSTVGSEVPSLESVREKIESRHARAEGMAELNAASVDNQMLEIEAAVADRESDEILNDLRAELGMVDVVEIEREQP